MTDSRSSLLELTKARILLFVREPEAMFWVFAFPLLMALALGIAFRSRPPERVVAGVLDQPTAADVIRTLEQEDGIDVRLVPAGHAESMLRNGEVQLLVVAGEPPTYRFDPARAESRLARLVVHDALMKAAGRTEPWQPREDTVMVRGSRYIDWLLPGLLGMNIMGTGMWSISFGIVNARTRKELKLLLATPMRRTEYLASHMLGRLAFLVLEVFVLLAFGWLVFDVVSRGSLLVVVLISFVGAATFSGLGLLAGSRVQTIEGLSGLQNLAMVPMWILSGVFFSSSNFPEGAQPLIRALPLTALNDALRAVMIEGSSLAGVAPELGILAAWGVVGFVLALSWFRWH
ncbi:MAG TPA: ABC transporter permease [Vicinamibacterales bacterium]|jgi:ABC-type multidrug transport system permease subunit